MRLFGNFKRTKKDAPQPLPPRPHHYQFAYRALPGLAFADAYVPLGFGHDTPKGSLSEFWKYVGAKYPENERLSDSGLSALDTHFGPDYVILLVAMPTPLRDTEAYFVAIIYPKSWFNDPTQENSEPDLRYFILAKSEVSSADGASGGTLRTLTKAGHGAVKFGVPVSVEAFLKEVQEALLNPRKWITWVDSKPWNFSMQDEEMKPIFCGMVSDVSALERNRKRKKLRIIVLDDEPNFLELYEVLIRSVYKDANVLKFANGDQALQELLRADLDLLIADIHHLGLPSREMLALLGRKKVVFPILVATGDRTAKEALQCEEFDLNVSYLSKPFDPEIVVEWLKTGLKITHNR
jgi:CheY-like chemotaxis protein